MTVATSTSSVSVAGDNASTIIAVPFYFLDNSHLQVVQVNNNVSPPTVTTLVLGTDYSVAGAGVEQGGAVTVVVPLPTGTTTTVSRNIPSTQLIHYVPNDPFPASTHERALDQLTMLAQQILYALGFVVTLPDSTAGGGISAQLPFPQGGLMLGWNAGGTALVNLPPIGLGAGQITDVFVSGSAGIQSSKLSFKAVQTGSVLRTVLNKLNEVLSPLDFGADPTGSLDSSTAMANFFTAIQASGVRGEMPDGTFKVTQGFTITSPVSLRGTRQTVIHNTNAAITGPVIHVTSAGGNGAHLENFSIQSVTVSNPAAHGIQIDGGTDFIIKDVNISGTYYGINISATQAGAYIRGCFVTNTVSHGIVAVDGNMTIDDCYTINGGGIGFYFPTVSQGSAGLVVSNCTNYNSGSHAFFFQGSSGFPMSDLLVTNCVNSTSPNGDGFRFDTFGKNITINGCFSEEAGVTAALVYTSYSFGIHFTPNNHRVAVIGCQATFSGGSGACMDCGYFSMTGGDYTSNNIGNSANDSGILVGPSGPVTGFNIVGVNTLPKPVVDVAFQQYGICLFGTGHTQGAISGCILFGNTAPLFISGSPSVKVSGSPNFINEVWGIAQIPNGSNTVLVNHGMSGTPTVVMLTPNNVSLGGLSFWSGTYTSSTFNINTSANVSTNTNFAYYARF